MLAHLAQIAAILVNQPHAGVDRIARAFVAERHGIVVKRTVDRVSEPALFLQNHAAFAGLQVDIVKVFLISLKNFRNKKKLLLGRKRNPARGARCGDGQK